MDINSCWLIQFKGIHCKKNIRSVKSTKSVKLIETADETSDQKFCDQNCQPIRFTAPAPTAVGREKIWVGNTPLLAISAPVHNGAETKLLQWPNLTVVVFHPDTATPAPVHNEHGKFPAEKLDLVVLPLPSKDHARMNPLPMPHQDFDGDQDFNDSQFACPPPFNPGGGKENGSPVTGSLRLTKHVSNMDIGWTSRVVDRIQCQLNSDRTSEAIPSIPNSVIRHQATPLKYIMYYSTWWNNMTRLHNSSHVPTSHRPTSALGTGSPEPLDQNIGSKQHV